jgi:hypothetical protein
MTKRRSAARVADRPNPVIQPIEMPTWKRPFTRLT